MRPSSSATRPRRRCARRLIKPACPCYSESTRRRRCARTRGPTASPTRSRVCFRCPFCAFNRRRRRRLDGVVARSRGAATACGLEVRSRAPRWELSTSQRRRGERSGLREYLQTRRSRRRLRGGVERSETSRRRRPRDSLPKRRRRGHRRRRRVVVARRGPHEALLPRGDGLYETGVPFYNTKNGPKTIRCGFTDSTERAAQHRRFT